MELDQETIENQPARFIAHRRRLHQQARLGDYPPPKVAVHIDEAQVAIRDLKAALRAGTVTVEDLPEDTAKTVIPAIGFHSRSSEAVLRCSPTSTRPGSKEH